MVAKYAAVITRAAAAAVSPSMQGGGAGDGDLSEGPRMDEVELAWHVPTRLERETCGAR